MKEERIVDWAVRLYIKVRDGRAIVDDLKELIKEVEADNREYYLAILASRNNCESE